MDDYLIVSYFDDDTIQHPPAKPTLSNLAKIEWKNEKGEVKKFCLKEKIVHKWKTVGDLVIPKEQLNEWAVNGMQQEECCEAMLLYWLDNPPPNHPVTWDGLYELLEMSSLGQVASELKDAVNNALTA